MATELEESTGLVPPESLARTYNPPGYADPWDAVTDYRTAMRYATRNPDHGATAISRRYDLPRTTVRDWLDGARPDCVRAIDAADDHDWLDLEPDSRRFRGLNALVVWVFAGGSIVEQTKVPYFTAPDHPAELLLKRAAGWAGTQLETTRVGEDGRPPEYRPVEDASVLGRVLMILGAPVGEKNPDSAVVLPAYLEDAPTQVRREFCQIYLWGRGQRKDDSHLLRFWEARSTGYLESLASFFQTVTGEPVSVSESNVTLSVAATREVESWDPPLEASLLEE